MRTAVLVLSIIGVVLSFVVAACTGACFSGLGEMANSLGDYSTAQETASTGGAFFLWAIIEAGLGLIGGIYAYRNWQLSEEINILNKIKMQKVKFGAILLIIAAIFSIHNTMQFFTSGVLFAIASLMTFIKGKDLPEEQ